MSEAAKGNEGEAAKGNEGEAESSKSDSYSESESESEDGEKCEGGELGRKRKMAEESEGEVKSPNFVSGLRPQSKSESEPESESEEEGEDDCTASCEQLDEVTFNQKAIDGLSIVLRKLEEEKNTSRTTSYVQVEVQEPLPQYVDGQWKWMALDVYDDGSVSLSCVHETMRGDKALAPFDLQKLSRSVCAAYKSKLIIAGGIIYNGGEFYVPNSGRPIIEISHKVFTYDTHLAKWETLPRMIVGRVRPTVACADDKIFVFGGHSPGTSGDRKADKVLIQSYAEYYDLSSHPSSWKYFHKPIPRKLMYHTMARADSVVYPNGRLILFWLLDSTLGSFNYETWEWKFYNCQDPICKHDEWGGDSAVVLDHFMFWHDDANIYAYNLSMLENKATSSKATPFSVYKFDDYNFSDLLCPTFLFHPGNDQLCLFWWEEKEKRVRYSIFQLQIAYSEGRKTLSLVLSRSDHLPNHIPLINNVVQVSYLVG